MTIWTGARYLILLGAPGAGKGTQAQALSRLVDIPYLASGDLFRTVRQEDSDLGALVRSFYDNGKLVPDDVTIRLVLDVLAREEYAAGAILDGFPRTLQQAQALDTALRGDGRQISKVLYLRVAPDELLRRIAGRTLCRNCGAVYHEFNNPPKAPGVCDKCGGQLYQRVDDTVETGRTRLDTYFRETQPLVEYYRQQDKLCEVDGEQSVKAVGKALQACVEER